MSMNCESILNDKSFKKFKDKKQNLREETITGYVVALMHYCNANNIIFHEFVKQQREEQRSRIIDGIIIEYDPDYGTVDTYQENLIKYLKEKGNRNTTIYFYLSKLNSILRNLGIKTPTMPQMEEDSKMWYGLSKEDIKYVLSNCNINYRAIITFMASTGMRKRDLRELKINDYIEATYNYHGCTELEDFLKGATDDMMGYWDYIPHKTRRHKIQQKTFNSPESNREILNMLRKRHSKTSDMSKEDYLFTSQNKNHKGQLGDSTINTQFRRLNKRLSTERLRLLTVQLENGNISEETYNKEKEKIP